MLLNENSRPFFTTEPKCFLPQTCHTHRNHNTCHSTAGHHTTQAESPPPTPWLLFAQGLPKTSTCRPPGDWGHNTLLLPLGIKGIFLSGPPSEPKSALSRCCAAASPTLPAATWPQTPFLTWPAPPCVAPTAPCPPPARLASWVLAGARRPNPSHACEPAHWSLTLRHRPLLAWLEPAVPPLLAFQGHTALPADPADASLRVAGPPPRCTYPFPKLSPDASNSLSHARILNHGLCSLGMASWFIRTSDCPPLLSRRAARVGVDLQCQSRTDRVFRNVGQDRLLQKSLTRTGVRGQLATGRLRVSVRIVGAGAIQDVNIASIHEAGIFLSW